MRSPPTLDIVHVFYIKKTMSLQISPYGPPKIGESRGIDRVYYLKLALAQSELTRLYTHSTDAQTNYGFP